MSEQRQLHPHALCNKIYMAIIRMYCMHISTMVIVQSQDLKHCKVVLNQQYRLLGNNGIVWEVFSGKRLMYCTPTVVYSICVLVGRSIASTVYATSAVFYLGSYIWDEPPYSTLYITYTIVHMYIAYTQCFKVLICPSTFPQLQRANEHLQQVCMHVDEES